MSEFTRSVAVVVGINKYQNGISQLHTATEDATELSRILTEMYNYKVEQLLDEEATLENIKQLLLETLPNKIRPTEEDRVLFYFAGHGTALNSEDGPTGYLVPQNAKPEARDTFLPMQELHNALTSLECRHLLTILDCCFAGAFRWSSTRDLLAAPEVIHKERYDRFVKDAAWQVITSAAHDQKALDILLDNRGISARDAKHSPFAEALFEAFQGGADLIPDGIITATELYLYLRDHVEIRANERQTPGLWPLKKHRKGEYIFLLPTYNPDKLPPAPELNKQNNPYRGLESYDEEHSSLFFGRNELVKSLYSRICDHQLTVVLGVSGSGKSSIVKAGLIPYLRQDKYAQQWHILDPLRPSESPFTALARGIMPIHQVAAANDIDSINKLSWNLQQEPQKFIDIVTAWSKNKPNVRLLLVIDQFEELITQCQDDEERQQFLGVLEKALAAHPQQLCIVLTLRSDFEPRFLDSPLKSHWMQARFAVRAMRSDELRQAIEGPASERVLYFEPPNLVDQLIDEVGQMPGALPLLSFTLSELYIKYLKRRSDDRALTEKDYKELGGVAGSLTNRATEEYEELDKAHQVTMRRVMLRMVTIEGGESARRQVPLSELVYPDDAENKRVEQVIKRLSEVRLIVGGQETGGEPYVEPAHDALVRGWKKLQEWKEQEHGNLALQQRLTPAAIDWKKGKGGLWTREEDRLAQLEQILGSSNSNWLNQLETEFINASKHQRLLELKEAERQRDEAIQGQISALNSLSEARFRANNQLGALVASVKAGKELLSAPTSVQNQVRPQTVATLQQTISEIQERNRLQGHQGLIWNISFSPDGKLLASASYDKTVRLWSVEGSLIKTFEGHSADAVCVSFSPDGKMLASASHDKTVKLWSVDGTLLKTLQKHTEPVTGVSFSPDGKFLASSSYDKTIKLWKTDGTLFKTFKGHGSWVRSVSFSPDSQTIASASADQTIKLWSCDGKLLKTFKASSDLFLSASFSPDGQLIASANADNTVKLWSLSGKLLKTLTGHSDQVQSISFSQNSQLIASASGDSTIKVWSRDGILLQTLRGHSNKVYGVSFNPNDQLMASASGDSTIRLWNCNKILSKTIRGHDHWVWSVSFSPDSQTLASASSDGTVKLWSRNGTLLQSLSWHLNIVDCVSFSPDGQLIASASADNTVKLWSYDGKELKSLEGHRDRVRGVNFSPDSQMIASTSHDRTIKLWNHKGTLLKTLEGHNEGVIGVSFSHDGQMLASTSYDRTVKLWKRNGTLIKTLESHTDAVIGVSFSPNGQLIASASDDQTIKLWNCDGTLHTTLQGHDGWVMGVSFSSDGQLIASASADHTIKIWSCDGTLLTTLQGHDDWVFGVSFSPDGQMLASASADRTIKLWNLNNIERNLELDALLVRGCDWLHDYLKNNPNISQEDRCLCRDIWTHS